MTADRDLWVVPGAPLADGAGWRLWYSHLGTGRFQPETPVVTRRGTAVQVLEPPPWDPLHPVVGVARRNGVLTVELQQPAPGEPHDIHIPELGTSLRLRSMPQGLDGGVTFLLASCCYLPGDKDGRYGAAVEDLMRIGQQPAFKFLVGDQAYQDVPVHFRLTGTANSRFARRYEEYWGDEAYQRALRSTPTFVTCDDHEFWNNFPERVPWLRMSWDEHREESQIAATALYEQYQRCLNPEARAFYSFEVPPVSFFVSDARSERDRKKDDDPHFFSEPQWAELEQWAQQLHGPGVLVLAQPLFSLAGGWTDTSLASFGEDFSRLCAIFEEALRAPDPHDILVVTGDIHTGRYGVMRVVGPPAPGRVHEFVASPASRVADPTELRARPKPVPDRFTVVHDHVSTKWERDERDAASIDNNVGLVRMEPGTLGENGQERVRFTLELWRVRRHVGKLARLVPRRHDDSLTLLFSKELQLR